MKNKTKNNKQLNPFLVYVFIITPFLGGLSQHYQTFIVAIICSIVLIIRWKLLDIKKIDLYILIPFCVIILFAFLSIFYGVSTGDAIYGFAHVVTAFMFYMVCRIYTSEERNEAINVIPYVGAIMVVVAGVAYIIPGLKNIMYVNGRMGGPFEYPNTLALYLLIGLYIVLDSIDVKHKIKEYVVIFILLAGILLSGSRSVFIMTAFLMIYLLIVKKNSRKLFVVIIGVSVLAIGLYLFLTNDMSNVGRFLTTSLKSSTFVGRILYDVDALKMIVNRPFGFGYLGYHFVQSYYQSGVYSVRFVHNDWLQLALDYGVISFMAGAWLYGLGVKRASTRGRIILILIGIHMLFDFDVQFFSIAIIMLLLLVPDNIQSAAEAKTSNANEKVVKLVKNSLLVCVSVACLWLSVADFMQSHSMREESIALYPWAADVKLHAMVETNDKQMRQQYALDLEEAVPYIGASYDVLSAGALENGDVIDAIDAKHKSVIYQKYNIKKYEEYANLLCDIIDKYGKTDIYIYSKAITALNEIPTMLQTLENETNSLAYLINDVPSFTMSEDVINRIQACALGVSVD